MTPYLHSTGKVARHGGSAGEVASCAWSKGIVRGRAKPDGMVLVVGSCAEGVQAENNIHADLLYTLGDAQNDMQVGHMGRAQPTGVRNGMQVSSEVSVRAETLARHALGGRALEQGCACSGMGRVACRWPTLVCLSPALRLSAMRVISLTCIAHELHEFFWEAFPAEGGKARTTYMFAYSDAEPARPNFEALLDRYFEDLVHYQVCV
eukprot:1157912-Pelagomonas_calceolata.AAC.3